MATAVVFIIFMLKNDNTKYDTHSVLHSIRQSSDDDEANHVFQYGRAVMMKLITCFNTAEQ